MDFMDAYDQLNNELLYIDSLLVAAVCAKEHNLGDRVVLDLGWLAKKKVELSRNLLKEMNKEYRKLEEQTNKDKPQPPA